MEAYCYAAVGFGSAVAEIDFAETEDLRGLHHMVEEAHSGTEGAHSEIGEEAHCETVEGRVEIEEAHSGIVVVHFEIGVADHSEIAADHFGSLGDFHSENLVGSPDHQEARIVGAVGSSDCSEMEVVQAG